MTCCDITTGALEMGALEMGALELSAFEMQHFLNPVFSFLGQVYNSRAPLLT